MTSGLYGFRKNGQDKTIYNNADSYPSWLGWDIAEICATTSIEELHKLYDNTEKKNNPMSGDMNSIMYSLFCKYAYIINLDTEKLEFWVGYQHEPQEGNRYGETADNDGYYPCRLVAEFPIAEINSPNAIVKQMNAALEKLYGKAEEE